MPHLHKIIIVADKYPAYQCFLHTTDTVPPPHTHTQTRTRAHHHTITHTHTEATGRGRGGRDNSIRNNEHIIKVIAAQYAREKIHVNRATIPVIQKSLGIQSESILHSAMVHLVKVSFTNTECGKVVLNGKTLMVSEFALCFLHLFIFEVASKVAHC